MNAATVEAYQLAKQRLIRAMETTRPPYGRDWPRWHDRRQKALLNLFERHCEEWAEMMAERTNPIEIEERLAS